MSTQIILHSDLNCFYAAVEMNEHPELRGKAIAVCGSTENCRFCKARYTCRARSEYHMRLAEYDFKQPDLLTDEEIADILPIADSLNNWVQDLIAYATQQAVDGKAWPGYKLVAGRSVRKYSSEAEIAISSKMNKTVRILPGGETELFYSNSTAEEKCIGHLRIDVDGYGKLWTSWWPHSAAQKHNREPFKAEFNALINALQRELFKKPEKLPAILRELNFPLMNADRRYYGFHIDTGFYSYYFRVFPGKGDYSYCYCYERVGGKQDG